METIEKQNDQKMISKHEFFFELPLYDFVSLDNLEFEFSSFFNGDVDAYSPDGFDTTYHIKKEWMGNDYFGYYSVKLTCRRKNSSLEFFLYKNTEVVAKVGQFPSLADLQFGEMGKRYNKVLSKNDLHDLKKAIGLSAHGAGAGSLVYLRRIFENIIWDTYGKNNANLEISEEDFRQKRMYEKVTVLKDFLPEQLVEMKAAYGVLSKGIHELSEKECLVYFPVLKLSIELILDQKIEMEIKENKNKSVKEQLENIVNDLK